MEEWESEIPRKSRVLDDYLPYIRRARNRLRISGGGEDLDPEVADWVAGNTHSHAYPEVMLGLYGEGHGYGRAGRWCGIESGTVLPFSPGVVHDATYGPWHGRAIDLWIHLLPPHTLSLNLVIHTPTEDLFPVRLPSPDASWSPLISHAIELLQRPEEDKTHYFLLYFCSEVLDYLQTSPALPEPGKNAHIPAIKRYIRTHLDDPLTLEHLSRIAGYSPFHFHRLFQQSEGITLRQFVEQQRLQKAQQLILQGYSMTHAALDSGFPSSSHFSRTFRRTFQRTPSDWLRNAGRPS